MSLCQTKLLSQKESGNDEKKKKIETMRKIHGKRKCYIVCDGHKRKRLYTNTLQINLITYGEEGKNNLLPFHMIWLIHVYFICV